MKKNNFKSFALVFVFNGFYLSFFYYFLPFYYFFFILIFFVALNIWMLFFPAFPFIRKLKPRLAFPTDPKDILGIWEEEKKTFSNEKALCYIVEKEVPLSFHFSSLRANSAVFSRHLLELLTPEEVKALVCYFFTVFSTNWSLFFTLLSFFCFPIWILCFLLEAPFRFFYSFFKNSIFLNKKKVLENSNCVNSEKKKRSEILSPLFFKLLPLFFYRVFLCMDKKTQKKTTGEALGSALWKVQSLYEVENFSPPLWMSPLFFGNPLTFRVYRWYFSFQPRLRQRVKALVGSYPP